MDSEEDTPVEYGYDSEDMVSLNPSESQEEMVQQDQEMVQ